MESFRYILSGLAVALTFLAFAPYLASILRGRTRPHVFSWVIWGSTTFIVFLAQLEGGGGIGAWPIGVSGVITIGIAALAWAKRGDGSITRLDWLFFLLALSSLPLWYLTDDPLWAVLVLTTVDLLGFGPTVRKAWHRPFEEHPVFFFAYVVRNVLVILALEHHSLTTVLFPAAVAAACAMLIAFIVYRRRVVGMGSDRFDSGMPSGVTSGGSKESDPGSGC